MDPGTNRLITRKDRPGIRVSGQYGPGTTLVITGQDGPRTRVTGQEPRTKRLIYGPRNKVTGQDGPGMKRLTKRNKNGHNDANEIIKRYLHKIGRIEIEEAEQGRVSEIVTLVSQASVYNTRDARM